MSSTAREIRQALADQLVTHAAQVLVLQKMPQGALQRTPAAVLRRAGSDRRQFMGGPIAPTFDIVAVVSLATEARAMEMDDLLDILVAAVEHDRTLGLPDVECFVEQLGDEERIEVGQQAYLGCPIRVPVNVGV